jgi:predicted nucleic acid-binding protein
MLKVFTDNTGWYAIVNANHEKHDLAKEYFQQLLDSRAQIYTHINEINLAISKIKKNCNLNLATEFSKVIDESILSSNVHASWLTRRLRRNSLKHFFSIKDPTIDIRHCIIFEEVKKKKINFIFSIDDTLKKFGVPLMPQA